MMADMVTGCLEQTIRSWPVLNGATAWYPAYRNEPPTYRILRHPPRRVNSESAPLTRSDHSSRYSSDTAGSGEPQRATNRATNTIKNTCPTKASTTTNRFARSLAAVMSP